MGVAIISDRVQNRCNNLVAVQINHLIDPNGKTGSVSNIPSNWF